MKRRDFLFVVGAAAATWPFAAFAQPDARMRRVGVLMPLAENDAEMQNRIAAFVRGLKEAGWNLGGNVRIDYRWTADRIDELRKSADELVKLAPDVILAVGSNSVVALLQTTRTVPIVFINVYDPVGAGFIASLDRPGGNVSGFARPDLAASGPWLAALKHISADVRRVAVLRDATLTSALQFVAMQSTAQPLGITVSTIDVRHAAEIEAAVADFARVPGGVLVVTASSSVAKHRDLIIALAAKYRLPAIYSERLYPVAGGLLSIGPDIEDEYRLAAEYINRILKGERPENMPIRASAKTRVVINKRTANALGITMPPALLARADEIIE
jgi:putative ABC transport system substrate-binding protein